MHGLLNCLSPSINGMNMTQARLSWSPIKDDLPNNSVRLRWNRIDEKQEVFHSFPFPSYGSG